MPAAKSKSRKAADAAEVMTASGNADRGVAPTEGQPSEPPARTRVTKATRLQQMLAAPDGATLARLCEATGWQSHTVRAALTRLRQAGHAVERSRSEAGQTVYRIRPAATAEHEPVPEEAPRTGQDRAAQPDPEAQTGDAQ